MGGMTGRGWRKFTCRTRDREGFTRARLRVLALRWAQLLEICLGEFQLGRTGAGSNYIAAIAHSRIHQVALTWRKSSGAVRTGEVNRGPQGIRRTSLPALLDN